MRNPLMDGTYKDYPYLSPTFIAEVDTMLTEPPMGMGDPFLCAQDIPTGIYADELYVGDNEARIVVREFFQGNPNPSYSVVNLNESNKQWIIESVQCGLLPSTLVELVFNQYITYARYDVENDIDRNPLTDWPFDWESFLNDDLLATLHTEGFVATDTEGQISFNRLLCAQDFPTRIYANVIDNTQTTTTVQVYGEYPSGQDTFSSMPLSQVVVESLPDGTWQLASIICQP